MAKRRRKAGVSEPPSYPDGSAFIDSAAMGGRLLIVLCAEGRAHKLKV
jgi:hypothetical protein